MWVRSRSCLGIRYQKVMKMKMIPGMRKALLSLIPPGYQEVIPSMVIRSLAHFLFTFNSIVILQCYCFYRAKQPKESDKKRKRKRKTEELEDVAMDEDVVEDLVLSSDEDGSMSDTHSDGDDGNGKPVPQNQQKQKQKPSRNASKKKSRADKSRKRKKANSLRIH